MSSQIVEGKIVSSQSFWDDSASNIYTAYTIDVNKVFKGNITNEVTIVIQGGVVGLQAEIVSHSIYPKTNDVGVFLLSDNLQSLNVTRSDAMLYRPVLDAQYFYKYSMLDDIASSPLHAVSGIRSRLYQKISDETQIPMVDFKKFEINSIGSSESRETTNRMNPSIQSFSASDSSAGTKSILTINGSNFGATKGEVGFSDADLGGLLYTYALDSQVINWSDTQIQVEIPDYAGTGRIRVRTFDNLTDTSTNSVNIDFAQINMPYDLGDGEKDFPTQYIDSNSDGGNTWQMNTSFYNSDAKIPFEKALEAWSCNTGVNWQVSSTTTASSTVANDDVNIVTFNSLPAGILGQCISRYGGCFVGGEIKWYVEELDIVFNSNINWNYTDSAPLSSQYDFESVAVHELGHGHQMGHVINSDQIMHYALSGGISRRQLSQDDIDGALDVMGRSATEPICSQSVMTESSCFAQPSLNNDDYVLEDAIAIYPNPATDHVIIKTNFQIEDITLYNVNGQRLNQGQYTLNNRNTLNFRKVSSGLYFLQIETTEGTVTKKVFVN
ncbi:T9SS type A sorting domain-containing protein [Winogradskyella maritima]|uniref:T9SS type A sorting domain-containing protein n=1 Tax=Winogradskyella maritima TaxID=1517766 RepID=A0ABV8AG09_9FLAO|nr:T9SS type A sorting domain-containing protein [Winogradskyella maritima]